jgi:methionine aminopeptidase
MSIETEDELEGLRRAGHVVAVVLRELRRRVQAGVSTAEHTIVVTAGRPLVLTA